MFSVFRTNAANLHASGSRAFSASIVTKVNRAIIYQKTGDPSNVLRTATLPPLPAPKPKTVNIRYLLSPINPADINVIQGVYPAKPEPYDLDERGSEPVYIAGNEGLAEVRDIGQGVEGLKVGDWVVMIKPQAGTWVASANVRTDDVIRVQREKGDGLSEVHAATMTVSFSDLYANTILEAGSEMMDNRSTHRLRSTCYEISWI